MSTTALELEAMPEYEEELEFEYEAEWEGELESEEFFRRLAALARQAAASPRLRRTARAAARAAAGGLGDVGAALGGPPGSVGARIGGPAGAAIGRILADLVPEQELEWEGEAEANPIRRVYPDALMEHLGHRAAETESEAEAEALVGALVPLAARLAPRAAAAIARAAPQLVRGVVGVTRTLRANPATRPLVRTVPRIVRQTATSLGRQAARGQPVTPRRAATTLARQTTRTLASPSRCVAVYRQSRALDRTYHGQVRAARPVGPGAVRPRQCPTCGG
jgi:hypothetical protein